MRGGGTESEARRKPYEGHKAEQETDDEEPDHVLHAKVLGKDVGGLVLHCLGLLVFVELKTPPLKIGDKEIV